MVILIRYGEIHLKGLNRPQFERRLKDNIKIVLKEFKGINIKRINGRFILFGFDENYIDDISEKLKNVFGIHSFSIALETDKDYENVKKESHRMFWAAVNKAGAKTFKVAAKRSDKSYKFDTMELIRELGGYLFENTNGISVDVKNPDITLNVEIREMAYIYTDIILCRGGLPVGCNGKAALLLSGGIDSPVSGYMTMKRGVLIECIHFYSFPYTGELAKQKVIDLCKILSGFGGGIRLHIVPFTEIQKEIFEKCPNSELTIIMRRFMMKIADRIAAANECSALITGESIGQVASQTLESLNCTNTVTNLPVIRPVICFDKQEIIEIAKDIDTFETSILPYEDCCTVFTPKRPVTHPNLERIVNSEQVLDTETLIKSAVENTEMIVVKG